MRFILLLGLSVSTAGCCCHHHHHHDQCHKDGQACREWAMDGPITAADFGSIQELVNDARLQPLLPPVRDAFRRDFSNVGVTGVRSYMSETGLLLTEITFLREGEPFMVVYTPNGTPLPLADMPQRAVSEPTPARPDAPPASTPPADVPMRDEEEPAKPV